MKLHRFEQKDNTAWDTFCDSALQATFLHTRRFLSYHKDRFHDLSLIIEDGGRWLGLFPAALSIDDNICVISHPGITYGGLLHQGRLMGAQMISALELICRHYADEGFDRMVYKAVPSIYHQAPVQDDLYALFRMGALRTRCDLSSTIDLLHRLPVSERRRRSLKKALKAGVGVDSGCHHIKSFWNVLEDNLIRKHGLTPVHSLDEITLLAERFPDNIRCVCAVMNGIVVAGTLLFDTPTTVHAQYIASSEAGYEYSALDTVFEFCIASAQRAGKRWFDFGVSTECSGKVLNDGLHRYKSEFGAGGTVYEFYEIDLS